MKQAALLLAVLLLISGSIAAQEMNPDGKSLSLHITPKWNEGSFESAGHDYSIDGTFGVEGLIKFPATNYFTLSVFYKYSQPLIAWYNSDGMKSELGKWRYGEYGCTLSFYFD